MGYYEDYLSGMMPTLVMDSGIATKDNIDLLSSMKLPYNLITRGHLFISLLAYHLLINIEYKLKRVGG